MFADAAAALTRDVGPPAPALRAAKITRRARPLAQTVAAFTPSTALAATAPTLLRGHAGAPLTFRRTQSQEFLVR